MISPRHQLLFIIGGAAIGILALVFFVLLPLQKSVRVKSEAYNQERITTAAAIEQQRNSKVMEREYERLLAATKNLDHVFIAEQDVLSFIAALENIAEESGVTQEIQNLQLPTDASKKSAFVIVLDGTFPNLVGYLSKLESLEYYVPIDRMSLLSTSPGTADSPSAIQMTLHAVINWL